MNISGLVRAALGDMRGSEAKTVELKTGQVVRGVVLELLDAQDAILSINGVQLRAKLETPLTQGESILLQVQPGMKDGTVVMKPITGPVLTALTDSMFGELLKQLGLKDTEENRALLLGMKQAGLSFTQENVSRFTDVLKGKARNIPLQEWSQAASIAVNKQLPLSGETVKPLHQVLFGQSILSLLQKLETGLSEWLARSPLNPQPNQSPVSNGGSSSAQVPVEGKPLLNSTQNAAANKQSQTEMSQPSSISPAAANGGGSPDKATALLQQVRQAIAGLQSFQPAASKAAPAFTGTALQAGGTAPRDGAAPPSSTVPNPAGAAEAQARIDSRPTQAAGPAEPPAAGHRPGPESAVRQMPPQATQAAAETMPAGAEEGEGIKRLLQALGIDHEHHLGKMLMGVHGETAPLPGGAEHQAARATETLKGLLLQATATDDLPPVVKEAAQQTIQHITGQQLLLTADRQSPFTHLTLFVPFQNQDGSRSAAVHVQTRKGAKGELDMDNCRLLFDLQLHTLGDTLVDVQIVNRIVSLNIRNDFPELGALLDSQKGEIAEALDKLGYQFISMKCDPFPVMTTQNGAQSETAAVRMTEWYEGGVRKGVDYRI
ncbi:hypothetical protein ABNE16_14975 [Paenibacillus larvae]